MTPDAPPRAHSHQWIDLNDPPIERSLYSPVIGSLRREMKRGTTYICRECEITLKIPAGDLPMTDPVEKKPRNRDLMLLFLGAFLQWSLTTAFTRWAVFNEPMKVFAAVFLIQSIWWVNIQRTTKENGCRRWFAWSLGAALGAVAGMLVS